MTILLLISSLANIPHISGPIPAGSPDVRIIIGSDDFKIKKARGSYILLSTNDSSLILLSHSSSSSSALLALI